MSVFAAEVSCLACELEFVFAIGVELGYQEIWYANALLFNLRAFHRLKEL